VNCAVYIFLRSYYFKTRLILDAIRFIFSGYAYRQMIVRNAIQLLYYFTDSSYTTAPKIRYDLLEQAN
jgi:hypothetical protein